MPPWYLQGSPDPCLLSQRLDVVEVLIVPHPVRRVGREFSED